MTSLAIRLITVATLLFSLASCSKDIPQPDRGDKPNVGGSDDDPNTPAYDFTPELRDAETRFTSPTISLNYSKGGIIAMTDNTTLSLINLSTGYRVDIEGFSPTLGPIDAKLKINGRLIDTSEIKVEHIASSTVWISILNADGSHCVAVFSHDN